MGSSTQISASHINFENKGGEIMCQRNQRELDQKRFVEACDKVKQAIMDPKSISEEDADKALEEALNTPADSLFPGGGEIS